jgi:hypothetical protein
MTDGLISMKKSDFLSTRHEICIYERSNKSSYSKERTGRNIFPSEELSSMDRNKNESE